MLGPYKAPGHPTEMLFGELFGGGQLRAWLGAGGWGRATTVAGAPPYWPANLSLSAIEAAFLGAGRGSASASACCWP